MNEFIKLDIHKLKRLKGKEKYHNFLLNMVRLYPVNIHKLNEFVYPNDKNVIFSENHSNANDFIVVSRLIIRHFLSWLILR